MTPERIAEIRERCEKATPGQWVVYDSCSWRRIGKDGEYKEILSPTVAMDGVPDLDGNNREADLDFIVNARTDIPDLLAEREVLVEALRFYSLHNKNTDIHKNPWLMGSEDFGTRALAVLREVGEE